MKRKSQGRLKLRQNQAKKKAAGEGGKGQSRQDWHTQWPRDERHGEHSESIILKGVRRE